MRADEKSAADVTADVGSEGGTPGDVEIVRNDLPATGSEADETARPGMRRSKRSCGTKRARVEGLPDRRRRSRHWPVASVRRHWPVAVLGSVGNSNSAVNQLTLCSVP